MTLSISVSTVDCSSKFDLAVSNIIGNVDFAMQIRCLKKPSHKRENGKMYFQLMYLIANFCDENVENLSLIKSLTCQRRDMHCSIKAIK